MSDQQDFHVSRRGRAGDPQPDSGPGCAGRRPRRGGAHLRLRRRRRARRSAAPLCRGRRRAASRAMRGAGRRQASVALGASRRSRRAAHSGGGGSGLMRILLLMDPLIAVPPRHYGGIERVIADLADRLRDRGHDVTLWAAPGSGTRAHLEPFGREGEWTRWSNVRNTLTLSARFARRPRRFDLIHNFGRLAYLATIFRRNVPKVQTYMRKVNPANMRKAAWLGARRLHFTGVSAAIRDTGSPGGGEWSVIYNCAAPG